MHTDIFKLIFHHDQRLNKLADETPAENQPQIGTLLRPETLAYSRHFCD